MLIVCVTLFEVSIYFSHRPNTEIVLFIFWLTASLLRANRILFLCALFVCTIILSSLHCHIISHQWINVILLQTRTSVISTRKNTGIGFYDKQFGNYLWLRHSNLSFCFEKIIDRFGVESSGVKILDSVLEI